MSAVEFGDARLPLRFWAKVRPAASGCWLWTGARNSKGYGCWSVGSRSMLAHRMAHVWLVGPIPGDLTVDHLCFERTCVNPRHFEVVSRSENSRRGAIRARAA